MANWTTLKDALVSVIRTNGNQEITGQLLQNTLLDIINSVGKHYQFIGLASQATIPQIEDGYAFYFAINKGQYPNFNITIQKNGLYIIRNNNSNTWELLDTSVLAFKDQDCYNLLYHKPLQDGQFYTHETAIAAIPSDVIKPGISIKYILADGTFVHEQFISNNIDGWSDANNWALLSTINNLHDLEVSINEVINTKILEVNDRIDDTDLEVSSLEQNKMEKDASNSNISVLKFNTTINQVLDQVGQMKYNPETKSWSGKTSADTEYDFGLEVIKYVKNDQGSSIANGKVVYVSGGQGKNVLVKLATTTDQDIAQRAFAVATQNISTFGFVCTYGAVRGINTSAFAEGDRLYLSTNGDLTKVEPVAPTPKIFIGICTYSHAVNGEIDVQIRPIPRLSKLSDVYSPTNATGNVLKWNDTTKRYENFNIDSELVQIRADLNILNNVNTLYPSVPVYNRIITDAGLVRSKKALNSLTQFLLDLRENTKLLFCPELGIKLRTSGINNYITKLYDISPMLNDAAQTTALNQPYLSGNIAPTEKYAIKSNHNTDLFVTHAPISFLATDKWSISTFLNVSASSSHVWYISENRSTSFLFGISSSTGTFSVYVGGVSYNGAKKLYNYYGKNTIVTLTSFGDNILNIYVNGVIFETIIVPTNITLGVVGSAYTQALKGTISYHCIRDIALTPIQVAEEYTYLRSLFPEIESVQIGTQTWATSNCEMTCTPQGNVIPEMQAATNVEKITNGINLIDSNNDGLADGFSTLNNPITSIVTGNGFPGRAQRVEYRQGGGTLQSLTLNNILSPNKLYRLSFKYRASRGYSITDTNSGISSGAVPVNIGDAIEKTIYFKHSGPFTILAFSSWLESSGNWFEIGDITLQEVGWSDSTNLYNYIYANTTGTAEQKEYAACKASAMWCYYNNDPALGAIYGKLYNWYAVKLLQMDIDYYNVANPTSPWGWRVPTSADFTTLQTYLGGENVAGSKLKKDGLDYWISPNLDATNSSGFTVLGSGFRALDGSSVVLKSQSYMWTTDSYYFLVRYDNQTAKIGLYTIKSAGFSLRLIKA